MKIRYNYVKTSREPTFPVVTKVYLPENNRVIVKHKRSGGGSDIILDYDFRNITNLRTINSPNGYADIFYFGSIENGEVSADFVFCIDDNTTLDTTTRNEIDVTTFPHYLYRADGETETLETGTLTPVSYITPAYTTKQNRAIEAILNTFRPQKRRWLVNAIERADLSPTLINKVANLLKAVDAALKNEFQNPNTDPLAVEQIAMLASELPLDINNIDTFMRTVNADTSAITTAKIWVNQNASGIEKVNYANMVNYPNGSLPNDYDPTESDWLVVNQTGSVILDNNRPTVNSVIQTTLTDPDGGINNTTWQWQCRTGESGTWEDKVGANSPLLTIIQSDRGKQIRVVATYNDRAGNNNTATSEPTQAVA